MPFKFDFRDGAVLEWSLDDDGATAERVTDYVPTIYVGTERGSPTSIRDHVEELPAVERTALESWRPNFRSDAEPVLRVDVASVEAVRDVARTIAGWGSVGEYRLYDVDFTPEFRYCLTAGIEPVPGRSLRTVELSASKPALADGELSELAIDGTTVRGSAAIRSAVERRLEAVDPDVLVVSSSELLPRLSELAGGVDLGRRPGYRKRAGASTYENYGRIGHSPARYSVPGRAVVDRSNTFLWSETNLEGCLYLVGESGLPLQELAWASIGRVLTAIQVREARDRGVLVPWRAWRPEFFKSMRQLHDADRGGFTFSPEVGVHEGVHELDFASLYPNIIVTRNVSPETVRCECHRHREDVPGLGYSLCDEDGYLPDVLETLVDDRARFKADARETADPERQRALEGKSSAIKWILVSCFGYQGFSNAKFGRIECHETINRFARDAMLDAKRILEGHGWRILHGIVDSLWVTPMDDREQTSLERVARAVTDEVGIRLEYEAAYDWLALVPRRNDDAGALAKYFGRTADGGFKIRGIECRQRTTCPFVADAQREFLEAYDEYRDPRRVCDVLAERLATVQSGAVSASELVTTRRVSKRLAEYDQRSRATAALRRAKRRGIDYRPGESVSFVVADDDAEGAPRVRLPFEEPIEYDPGHYATALRRAAESVLAPVGWRRPEVDSYLAERDDASLSLYS